MTMESTINFPNGINNGKPIPMAPTSANTKVLADLSWFEII